MIRENDFDNKLIKSLGNTYHIISSYFKHDQNTFKNTLLKLHIRFCSRCEKYLWSVYILGLLLVIILACVYHSNLMIAGKMLVVWLIATGICIYEGIKLYSLIPKLVKRGYRF